MTPWPLARLGAKRALPPRAWVGFAAVLALGAAVDWVPAATSIGTGDPSALGTSLRRQGNWSLALLVFTPFAILQASRIVPGWRRGDVEWLAQSTASPVACLAITWSGQLAAFALALVSIFVVIETQVDSSLPVDREGPALDLPSMVLTSVDYPAKVRLRIDRDEAVVGARLQSEFFAWNADRSAARGSSNSGALVLEVRRLDALGETIERSRASVPVGPRSRVDVELPPGGGDYELAWTRGADTPTVLLPRGCVRLLHPAGSGYRAGLDVVLRSLLLLAAATGLAAGLGAWMRTGFGFGLAIAVLLAIESLGAKGLGASSTMPLGAWMGGLESLGRGRMAAGLGWETWAWSIGLAAAGLGMGQGALGVWRRSP